MHYVTTMAGGSFPKLKISDVEFLQIKKSSDILHKVLYFEEFYLMTINNYMAFEEGLSQVAIYHMLHPSLGYSDFHKDRLKLNTLLANYFSSIKLYRDRISSTIRKCAGEDARVRVEAKVSEHYDSNSEFQFIDALRNHVQHYGLPIHLIKYGAKAEQSTPSLSKELSVDVIAKRDALLTNPKFKKSILPTGQSQFSIKRAVRVYMEILSEIHTSARKLMHNSVDEARCQISSVKNKFKEHSDSDIEHLYAYELVDGKEKNTIHLLDDWDNIRLQIQAENQALKNLHKTYVTGKL